MLKKLFGLAGNDLRQALQSGATIVDVRTVHEYDQGRLPGSVNIPVDRIPANMDRIRHMKKPIIFCGSGDSRTAHVVRFVKKIWRERNLQWRQLGKTRPLVKVRLIKNSLSPSLIWKTYSTHDLQRKH